MTDYFHDTGTTGQMLIRDTGTYIEFHINSGNSSSYNHQLPWGYILNGTNQGNLSADYSAGMGWLRLLRVLVTVSQTVTFKLGDTGTGGMGGPTNFSVAINRAQVPSAPGAPWATVIGPTNITLNFHYGSPNGATVTNGQISYTLNPSIVAEHVVNAPQSAAISGLVRGGKYYFRARCVNSEGWSAWGAQSTYTLDDLPDQGSPVTLTDVRQTAVKASITAVGNGGQPIDSYQILWSTHPSPEDGDFVVVSVPQAPYLYQVNGLKPGTTYNFWSRPHNSVGWGPWSATRTTKTLAGAYVKDGSLWKPAVPWVKDGGVWKIAKPWGKVSGTWRESF